MEEADGVAGNKTGGVRCTPFFCLCMSFIMLYQMYDIIYVVAMWHSTYH